MGEPARDSRGAGDARPRSPGVSGSGGASWRFGSLAGLVCLCWFGAGSTLGACGGPEGAGGGRGGRPGTGGTGATGGTSVWDGGAGETSVPPPTELTVEPFDFTYEDEPLEPLVDGGEVRIRIALQGGHVLKIGARVYGLESDTVELGGRLRNPADRHILAEESRTVVTQAVAGRDGWRETDRRTDSQSTHVPLCPNYGNLDLVDGPVILELWVRELYADDTEGRVELTLTPRCVEGSADDLALCACECRAGYVLGGCAPDGG